MFKYQRQFNLDLSRQIRQACLELPLPNPRHTHHGNKIIYHFSKSGWLAQLTIVF